MANESAENPLILERIVRAACNEFKALKGTTLKPFVPFLTLKGMPLNFRNHFPMLPFFKIKRPRRTVYMCARQLGKSVSLGGSSILRSRVIGEYDVLGIQPRFEQIKRFSTLYTGPMINNSLMRGWLVDNNRESSIMQRAIGGGGTLHYAYAFLTPDATRGFAVQELDIDESVVAETLVTIKNKGLVKIIDIKAGDTIDSFDSYGNVISSVVEKDASYHGNRHVFKLTLNNGSNITGTSESFVKTDKGWYTIGGLIEHEYLRRIEQEASAVNSWDGSRGREYEGHVSREDSELYKQPWLVSERVQHDKVPDLTRIYRQTSRENSEQRLRRILQQMENKEYKDIKVAVRSGIHGREEADNAGPIELNKRRRPCLVALRRWISGFKNKKKYNVPYRGLSERRGISSQLLVKEHLGYRKQRTGHIKQTCRRRVLSHNILHASGNREADRVGRALYTGMYEIQNRFQGAQLCYMRNTYTRSVKHLLRKLLGDQRQGEVGQVQCEEQKQNKYKEQRILCDTRRVSEEENSSPEGIFKRSGEQREQECSKTEAERQQKRGSGLRSGAHRRTQALLGQAAEGSGASGEEVSQAAESRKEETSERRYFKKRSTSSMEEGQPGEVPETAGRRKSSAYGTHGEGSCIQREAEAEESKEYIKGKTEKIGFCSIDKIEYAGKKDVYDISVVGTKTFFANGIAVHNCQDIQNDFIPIIEEVLSAQTEHGIRVFSGTPKSFENTLSVQFNKSSMAYAHIKCEHCNYENIANKENHIYKMIGNKTCICAKCFGGRETILIKYRDYIRTITFSELWASSLGEDKAWEDGTRRKIFDRLEVWDENGWTALHQITLGKETMLRELSSPRTITATCDHPIMIKGEEVELKDCAGKELTICKHTPIIDKNINSYAIATIKIDCNCTFCGMGDVVSSGGGSGRVGQKTTVACNNCGNNYRVSSPLPKKVISISGYLIGMFLADGNIIRKDKQAVGVCYTQNKGAIADKIEEELNKGDIPYKKDIVDKKVSLRVFDTQVGSWFRRFGERCEDKRLSSDFMYWSNNMALGVLAGLIDGDGSAHRNTYVLRMGSHDVIKQLTWLLTDIGTHFTSCIDRREGRDLYSISFRYLLPEAVKTIDKYDTKAQRPIARKVSTTRIARQSYDVTTSSGTLFVNGILAHNCGKPLNLYNMRYIHHYPDRRNKYEGYHISQVTHPLHAWYPEKWSELVDKLNDPNYGEVTFENEILGLPSAHNNTPLSEAELRDACDPNIHNTIQEAKIACQRASMSVMGVDWSGFGEDGTSTTVVVIAVSFPGDEAVRIVYAERLNMGADAQAEAAHIRSVFNYANCEFFAHDFSGAGTIREALISQMGINKKKFIPFDIVHAPVRKKIISFYKPTDGGRSCYNIDKTRSLMVLFQMIKNKKIILPNWDESKLIISDLLNIMQETRSNPRGSDFMIMDKVPNTTDDCAHAINFACSTIWHSAGKYPNMAPQIPESEYEDGTGGEGERKRLQDRLKELNIKPKMI